MNIIIKFFISISILIFFATSCEDFLDKEPYGAAAGAVMETPEGVEGLLIGAYSNLNGTTAFRSDFGGAMTSDWTYGSVASDDTYKVLQPEIRTILIKLKDIILCLLIFMLKLDGEIVMTV